MSEQNTDDTTSTTDADELATLRKNYNALAKDIASFKQERDDALVAKEEAEENAKNASVDEMTRLKNQLAKAGNDILNEKKLTADAIKSLHVYKADNEIAKLLIAHKVQPDDAPMVTAYLNSLRSLDDDGALTFDGQTAEAFGKSYFTGAGKRYTALPDNSGGGSTGSNGSTAAIMTSDNWNWTTYAQIKADNPALAKSLAKNAGKKVD